MGWEDPRFAFPNAKQYAFLFENVHLMLLSWDRDDAKFLFMIKDQTEQGLTLDYPGQLFADRVLDTIQNIFFVKVQENQAEAKRYVLGSYFDVDGRVFGAYYEQDRVTPDVALFRIDGEAPGFTLEVPKDEEYQRAASVFAEQHGDFMDIQAASD